MIARRSLTAKQCADIYQKRNEGATLQALALEFDVSPRTISSIVREGEVEGKLRNAALSALAWLEFAPISYHNGNTDPTGVYDEGDVRGRAGHQQVVARLYEALSIEDREELGDLLT